MMSLAAARTSYFSHSSLLTSPPTFSTLKYVTFVQAAGHWSLHHTRLLVYTSWQQSTHLRHSETQYTEETHTGLLPGPAQTAPCWLPVFTQAAYSVQYTVHCTPVHCTHLASSHLDLLTHGHTVPTLGSIVLSGPPVTSSVRGATQCIACSNRIFELKRGFKNTNFTL